MGFRSIEDNGMMGRDARITKEDWKYVAEIGNDNGCFCGHLG